MGIHRFRLQAGEDAEGLRIALKTTTLPRGFIQRALAVVAIGRVADVMTQPSKLCEIRIRPQGLANATSDLRHLQRVGQARARGIPAAGAHHLRLIRQPAQSRAVQNACSIAVKVIAPIANRSGYAERLIPHRQHSLQLVG